MMFSYQCYAVVSAIEKYLEEYKNNVDVVGYKDYDHFFGIYETLTRMKSGVRPTTVYLDVSELNALEEYL